MTVIQRRKALLREVRKRAVQESYKFSSRYKIVNCESQGLGLVCVTKHWTVLR